MDGRERFFPHHEVHVGKDLGGRTVVVDEGDVARYEAGTATAAVIIIVIVNCHQCGFAAFIEVVEIARLQSC
jgi:hypothetical protein